MYIEDFLPLKPVVFHILLALVERDLHGYGIVVDVRERSEGRIRLETGPLYRHLRKLLDSGLVEEAPDRPSEDGSRRGVHYRLTRLGRRIAAAEASRLRALVATSEGLGLVDGHDAP